MSDSTSGDQNNEDLAILRAILKTAVDGIITIDHKGVIQHVNPAACDMFGYSKNELISQNISMLMPSPHREEHDGFMNKYLETGQAQIIGIGREVEAVRKDGSLIDVDLAVSEVRVGTRRLFTGILRDMTSRNLTEDALRRQQTFSDNLIDTANAIVVVLDTQGRIARINPYLEKLSGYRFEEIQGCDWFGTMLPEEDQVRHRRLFQKVLTGTTVRGHVNAIVTKSGEHRMIAWSARVLHDADDIREGVLSIGNDITELKQAENQLIAQERLAAIGQMVTGLAHESRNALQRARACLDVLGLDAEDESKELIRRTETALFELQRLYEEVRNYAAPLKLERSKCDMIKLCRETWKFIEDVRANKSVHLRIACDADSAVCTCDRGRMQQVLRNIFENALAVAPDDSEVTVRCRQAIDGGRPMLQLTICDEGPGFTKEQAAQIFTPFYTTKTKGTGLGMAITQRIVDAHGGKISVGEQKQPGAEIVILLPNGESPVV